MRRREPPPLATWMLTHLAGGDRDEALDGDLLEEFHSGRSKLWFWRQATVATALGLIRGVLRRRVVFVFAVLWSLLSPGWDVLFLRFHRADFAHFIWRMPWPWSTLCDFGWSSLNDLVFIWIGAVIYLMLLAVFRKHVNLRSVMRGMIISIVVYCSLFSCWIALITLTLPRPPFRVFDWHALAWWNMFANFGLFGIAPCLPYLTAMLCALWGTESSSTRPQAW